jgi:hypothetical protein
MKNLFIFILLLSNLASCAQTRKDCRKISKQKVFSEVDSEAMKQQLNTFLACNGLDNNVDKLLFETHLFREALFMGAVNIDLTYGDLLESYQEFQQTTMYDSLATMAREMNAKYETLSKTYPSKANWDSSRLLMEELEWKDLDTFKTYCFQGSYAGMDLSYLDLHNLFTKEQEDALNKKRETERQERLNNSAPFDLCQDARYAEILRIPHGLKGYFDLEQAVECAKSVNKPILVSFTGHGCVNNREMEAKVLSDSTIQQIIRENFVYTELYVDDKTRLPIEQQIVTDDGKRLTTIGKVNAYLQIEIFHSNAQPSYYIINTNKEQLTDSHHFDLSIENFKAFLNKGLNAFNKDK